MKNTKAGRRQHTIIQMLKPGVSLSVEELCQELQCSPATIRNDLNYLAEKKQLVRIFGGARGLDSDHSPVCSAWEPEVCDEIASYVVDQLIPAQSTIILDNDPLSLDIAQLISMRNHPVSVLTFSLPVINILAATPSVTLYSFGGLYKPNRQAFFDDYIREHVRSLHADIYFMSTCSVSPEAGFTISCKDAPITECALMEISTRTIALCDSSNLCKSSPRIIADFRTINTMVTDRGADPAHVRLLTDAGLNVLIPGKE